MCTIGQSTTWSLVVPTIAIIAKSRTCIVAACCFAVTGRHSANGVYKRCLNSLSHELHIVGIQYRNTACTHPKPETCDPSYSTM
jgi:hypothetical protein